MDDPDGHLEYKNSEKILEWTVEAPAQEVSEGSKDSIRNWVSVLQSGRARISTESLWNPWGPLKEAASRCFNSLYA